MIAAGRAHSVRQWNEKRPRRGCARGLGCECVTAHSSGVRESRTKKGPRVAAWPKVLRATEVQVRVRALDAQSFPPHTAAHAGCSRACVGTETAPTPREPVACALPAASQTTQRASFAKRLTNLRSPRGE